MAFDGNGTFNRIFSWATDASNGIDITASRVDTEDSGFATGLSLCVTRDGQGKMASSFISSADNSFDLGSVATRWRTLYSANAAIGVPTSGTALTVTCALTFAAINSQGSIIVGGNTLTHANQNLNTQIILQGGSAEIVTVNGSAAVNSKLWSNYADSTGFYAYRLQSDDYNTVFTYWDVVRTGVASAVVHYTGITGNSVVTFSPPDTSVFLLNVSAGTTASKSNGIQIVAGTNSSDLAFQVNNGANSASFFQIPGNGNIKALPSTSANTASLTVTGQANSTAAVATFGGTAGNFITVTDGAGIIAAAQASTGLGAVSMGASSNHPLILQTNSATRMVISNAGAITFSSVATTTTAPGAGGAGALPATPTGYATFTIGATSRQIAYY